MSRWISTFLVFFLSCLIQTTLWPMMFGDIPAPQLWLMIITYIGIYRQPTEGLITAYILGYLMTAFTLMPLKIILISVLLVFGVVYLIRSRLFWGGNGYFTMMVAIALVTHHLGYIFISRFMENNPTGIDFMTRFQQILITPIFSLIIYKLLQIHEKKIIHDYVSDPRGVGE